VTEVRTREALLGLGSPLVQPAYIISKALEEFAAAREQLGCLMDQLQAEHVLRREHGEVEEWISKAGTELLRLLLQGYLDLRAAREAEREAIRGADGVKWTPDPGQAEK
jgi:hypothetical protein